MGLFDIFNAEARKQKSFDKMRAKLVSKNMQHDDRMWCIQQLAEMDNEEATRALFRRWDMVSDKKREDLAEKEYLADVLVQKGDSMLPSLREHNDRSVNITWPIQVLRRIATDEEVVDELVRVLDAETLQKGLTTDQSLFTEVAWIVGKHEYTDAQMKAIEGVYDASLVDLDDDRGGDDLVGDAVGGERRQGSIRHRVGQAGGRQPSRTTDGLKPEMGTDGEVESATTPHHPDPMVPDRGRDRHRRQLGRGEHQQVGELMVETSPTTDDDVD